MVNALIPYLTSMKLTIVYQLHTYIISFTWLNSVAACCILQFKKLSSDFILLLIRQALLLRDTMHSAFIGFSVERLAVVSNCLGVPHESRVQLG